MTREELVKQFEQALPYVREGYAVPIDFDGKQSHLLPWRDSDGSPDEIIFKWEDVNSKDNTFGEGWSWQRAAWDVDPATLADAVLTSNVVTDSTMTLYNIVDLVGSEAVIAAVNRLFSKEDKEFLMETLENEFDLPENLNEGNFEEFVVDMHLEPVAVTQELENILTDAQVQTIYNYFVETNKITDSVGDSSLEYEINSLLAEEYIAWFQYYSVIPFAVGDERDSLVDELSTLADDELSDHAQKLIERLSVLGLRCLVNTPESWNEYAKFKSTLPASYNVIDIINQNVEAEQNAIEHYNEAYSLAISIGDIVTADIFKQILADEQEHLSTLRDFYNDLTSQRYES